MSIVDDVSPRKFQDAVARGHKRLQNFRNARLHFIQEYVGPYYDTSRGEVGSRPLQMMFNAVRVLIPSLVMNFPKHFVMTPYLEAREYANLLALALDQHDMKINIKDTYRAAIVDAIFTLGILKTGLCESDSVLAMDDMEGHVDPGTVYTEKVDFDDFLADPDSRDHLFRDAAFLGDRIVAPRRVFLESGLYRNDLIERMPSLAELNQRDSKRADAVSMKNIDIQENAELEDEIAVYELWVPGAKSLVTVPASDEVKFDDYLRLDDYYGPDVGPYSLLALTAPVPGNPMPVPMAAVMYDLSVKANEMAKKIIEQATRQKDITTYRRNASDDAEEVKNASDGDMVAVDDPTSITTVSYGGQKNENENHLASLMAWFNMMGGNPEQLSGQRVDAKSATAANILQQNAGVVLEDMKDQVYQWAADEAGRRAWYFHTDPLMQMPLVRRQPIPGQMMMAPDGRTFMTPPTVQDVQVILTPEARRGDYLDFTFRIEPESMGRVDSKVRVQQMQALFQQVLPAIMAAAQMALAMGIVFSPKAALLRAAKDMGIEWFDEVFNDPEMHMQMMQQMMMGPQPQDSKGQAGPPKPGAAGAGNGHLAGIMQNGQPGGVMGNVPGPQTQNRQFAQAGAEDAQREAKMAMSHALAMGPHQPAPFANTQAF